MQSRLHTKTFKELCKEITTIEDLLVWYCEHRIRWPKETSNACYFRWPDDIIKHRIGNCYDHANFVTLWAKEQGLQTTRLIIWVNRVDITSSADMIGHIVPIIKPSKKNDLFCLFNYMHDFHGSINYFKSFDRFLKLYPISFKKCVEEYINPVYGKFVLSPTINLSNIMGPYLFIEDDVQWVYKNNNKKIRQDARLPEIWNRPDIQNMISKDKFLSQVYSNKGASGFYSFYKALTDSFTNTYHIFKDRYNAFDFAADFGDKPAFIYTKGDNDK